MCGRYTVSEGRDVAETFSPDLVELAELPPRYNIAPTQQVPALVHRDGRRVLTSLTWGLVPSWAKDPAIGSRMINARSETARTKPAFRSAFKSRRCLLPADGFFEWDPHTKPKTPWYFRVGEGEPFVFAGLWERWRRQDAADDEPPLTTCTILTTQANALLDRVHDRMPVILPPAAADTWLNPESADAEALEALLQPFPAERMTAYAVSTRVNRPQHDDPGCIAPADTGLLF